MLYLSRVVYVYHHMPFQVVGRGHFATVWQGNYRGSAVAVKVFPAGRQREFTSEKEVYQLPLMKHAGIVDFLGAGRKPGGGEWLVVVELAACVSGNKTVRFLVRPETL